MYIRGIMKGIFEQKNTGAIKDIDIKSRIVTGYLSAFGNVDSDNDIIEKGAFSKSINERFNDIFYLQQHDWTRPLGKFTKLEEDEKGLYFEGEIINTSFGEDQLKLYEAGIVKEHSIGFTTVKADFKQDEDYIRIIKEVKLYEGSAVTLGANSNTPFLGFKSSVNEAKDLYKKILKAHKDGSFTDETHGLFEIALKQFEAQIIEEYKSTQENQEPPKSTPKIIIEPQIIKSIFTNFTI